MVGKYQFQGAVYGGSIGESTGNSNTLSGEH